MHTVPRATCARCASGNSCAPCFLTEILPDDTQSNHLRRKEEFPTRSCRAVQVRSVQGLLEQISLRSGRMLGRWIDFWPDARGAICLPGPCPEHLLNGDMTSACQSSPVKPRTSVQPARVSVTPFRMSVRHRNVSSPPKMSVSEARMSVGWRLQIDLKCCPVSSCPIYKVHDPDLGVVWQPRLNPT